MNPRHVVGFVIALMVFLTPYLVTASFADTTTSATTAASATARNGVNPNMAESINTYAPAHVKATFPFTRTVYTTVVPYAGGLFDYNVSTTQPNATVNYNLHVADNYEIEIDIQYPVPVSGVLHWSIFSAGQTLQTIDMPFFNTMTVTASLTVQAAVLIIPPSAQQIANATVGLLQSHLSNFEGLVQQEISQQGQNFMTIIWAFMTALGVVCGFVVALFLILWRKVVAPQEEGSVTIRRRA